MRTKVVEVCHAFFIFALPNNSFSSTCGPLTGYCKYLVLVIATVSNPKLPPELVRVQPHYSTLRLQQICYLSSISDFFYTVSEACVLVIRSLSHCHRRHPFTTTHST